jgi:serine protease Do
MGIGEVGEAVRRSTVQVRSAGGRRQSSGSGVIWDSRGTIVTNSHVLGKGKHIVEFWDGSTIPADLEVRDGHRDLAKLKVPASSTPVNVRDSPIKPGELVIAVGSPLGFSGALSTGVVHTVGPVSGLGRRKWVQASIRLAPGNSGGPLVDASGRLVGINTMIVQGGIALAIPGSVAWDFVRNGPSPRLGVTVKPVNPGARTSLALLVLSVEKGSPADYASLLIGDLLVGSNAIRFASPADLTDSIDEAGQGILKLRFLRGDRAREREVAISLANRSGRGAV